MNMSQDLCPDRAWVQWRAEEIDDKQETNKHDASNKLSATKEIKQGDGIEHVWRCRGGQSKRETGVPGAMGNASLDGDKELRSEWWQRTSSANASPETQQEEDGVNE